VFLFIGVPTSERLLFSITFEGDGSDMLLRDGVAGNAVSPGAAK
jgi:hypothetical protein